MKPDKYEELANRVDLLQLRIQTQEDMRSKMYYQLEIEQLQDKMKVIVQKQISKEIGK